MTEAEKTLLEIRKQNGAALSIHSAFVVKSKIPALLETLGHRYVGDDPHRTLYKTMMYCQELTLKVMTDEMKQVGEARRSAQ